MVHNNIQKTPWLLNQGVGHDGLVRQLISWQRDFRRVYPNKN